MVACQELSTHVKEAGDESIRRAGSCRRIDEFDGHPEIRKRVLPFRFGRKPLIVPRVVTPLGSQAKLPGLRKSNSFKKLFAALKPVSETSDCKGCDRLLIDCVTPQDLKPA